MMLHGQGEITKMREFTGVDISKEKVDIGWLRDVKTGKKKTKVFYIIGNESNLIK